MAAQGPRKTFLWGREVAAAEVAPWRLSPLRAVPMPNPTPSIEASAPPRRPTSLVLVGPQRLELLWNDAGTPVLVEHAFDAASTRGSAIAETLARMLEQGPGPRTAVTVVLGEDTFTSQQILLGRLPEDEVDDVLARRAANLVSESVEDTLYLAQRLVPPFDAEGEADVPDSNWILHVRSRTRHRSLLFALREARIRIQRVVALRDVLPRLAESTPQTGGEVVVTYDGAAVLTHLTRDDALVQVSRLRIDPDDSPENLHVSVVQEVRQVAAFWAKSSRGAPITAVTAVGFAAEDMLSMSTPLSIATQGAEFKNGGASDSRDATSARLALLEAIERHARSANDLRIPLPPRRARVAQLTAATTAVAALIGWSCTSFWSERVDSRASTIASMQQGLTSLVHSRDEHAAFARARTSFDTALASVSLITERGIPFEAVSDQLRRTFTEPLVLEHVAIDENEGLIDLIVRGRIIANVTTAAARLAELDRKLGADPSFDDVSITPSTRVPDDSDDAGLGFTLTARFVGGDA